MTWSACWLHWRQYLLKFETALMKRRKQHHSICLSLVVLMLLLASPGAYAYLDPSTGSMVVSAIVGVLASIALALKTYWYRIRAFFRRGGKKNSSLQQPPE
jgi:O-antigen/teichoic acid export membrane protein